MQDSSHTSVFASHLDPLNAKTLQKQGTHEESHVNAAPPTKPLNIPHVFIPLHILSYILVIRHYIVLMETDTAISLK